MENLDKIHEYVKDTSIILIINNNSKILLDTVFNLIYKKYPSQKSEINSCKGLKNRLFSIKNKLVKINFDLIKIQFSSSNNYIRLYNDLSDIKLLMTENKSKLLFKTDISLYKDCSSNNNDVSYKIITDSYYKLPRLNIFDLVILIDKENIKILRYNPADNLIWYRPTPDDNTFQIDQLIRSTKLKQLQKIQK